MTSSAPSGRPGLSRQELLAQIAERRPWYQRIEFPEHGVTTTDDPANAMLDAAWDNKVGDLSLTEAAILRPQPKWREIRDVLPDVRGLDVLEVGSNCGYFSFEFAKAGARRVVGLDVSWQWLEKARWAASVLGYGNVEFRNVDFMNFAGLDGGEPEGLLGDDADAVPLPNGLVDVVFMSTVIDHLFFPLFAIYKMLRVARRHVVIDCPVASFDLPHGKTAMTLDVAEDGTHHGFLADPRFWKLYVTRLGVPAENVRQHFYNDDRGMCMVVDCAGRKPALWGA